MHPLNTGKKPVQRKYINQYLTQQDKLTQQSERLKYKPIVIEQYKFISRECSEDVVLIFIMDLNESDEDAINKINRAASSLRRVLEKHPEKYVKKNYDKLVSRFIQSRFVISLVGQIGVGKTSLLHLLMGKPSPETHIPTIAVNTEVVEDIRFANYELIIFDFAGQETAGGLWDFSSTDMIFLLTDSSLKNIIASKGILSDIAKAYPDTPLIVIANKQDTPNALDPTVISKVMGLESHAMVAIDLAYRDELLEMLVTVLSSYFEVDVPDVPVEQLLCIDEET